MRTIDTDRIARAVATLCVKANTDLNQDTEMALRRAKGHERSPVGIEILDQLLENAQIARNSAMPICQDTGLAVVFCEIGQDVHIQGGALEDAINQGVAKGYTEGYLRSSGCKRSSGPDQYKKQHPCNHSLYHCSRRFPQDYGSAKGNRK